LVTEHVPLLDGPTPSPSALDVAGETDVSVTLTLPAVVTVNVKTIAPFGASWPLNESVDAVVEGPDESLKGLLHAAALISTARSKKV
jgi:hypothetical protein